MFYARLAFGKFFTAKKAAAMLEIEQLLKF
jgi:hypothetical protein